ncbi:MAG: group 1 truncated hemoglobin [Rubrivivax sp.]
MMRRLLCLLSLLLATVAAPAQTADDTLYRALGAQDGISALMLDFVARLKTDARIGHFFKDTNAKYLAEQLRDQVCELAGGPCRLDGPSMKKAHEDMKIGSADFNRLVELLQQAMEQRGLPFGVQNRLLARLAPMHREIVNQP